ncbi:MAG: hypothetical protein LBM93_13210 [Oscillospiraceae bacterium]|nr:hypothetical protein [Oscillospiraceae bacterium]
MNETVKKFIGKDCLINTVNSTVDGVIESVEDNWVFLKVSEKYNSTLDMINIEYISRIREYPTDKNGKRKTIF